MDSERFKPCHFHKLQKVKFQTVIVPQKRMSFSSFCSSFVKYGICFLVLLLSCQPGAVSTSNPCTSSETCGSMYSTDYLHDVYYSGLRRVTSKATSRYCKQRIEYEFMKHFRALADESVYPFENVQYHTQCINASEHTPLRPLSSKVTHLGRNDSLKLMPNVHVPIDPARLSILYIMLVHNHPDFALRIINALDEPIHTFVIHVDASADSVQAALQARLQNRTNVHLIQQGRERISWGGFSIVNATLNAMRYAYTQNIPFDFLMDISGTTYPIKSNGFIRQSLAENPNALFMETYPQPARPEAGLWHQFVECDGALHRIARMPALRGINMHVSSQWFAVPRHYVHWLLHSTLARDYVHYAQYIIIADENYFATMFFNSPYCRVELKKNLVFLLFDKWEHERNTSETGKPRDPRKCLGVGPSACGRSPTTLTMEYQHLLGSSRSLFARKFDPDNAGSVELADYIDSMRGTHGDTPAAIVQRWDTNRDNFSVSTMIRVGHEQARNTFTNATTTATSQHSSPSEPTENTFNSPPNADSAGLLTPEAPQAPAMCLTLMQHGHRYIKMETCDPADPHQWFEIGRCTHGYELQLQDGKCPSFHKLINSSSSSSPEAATTSADADSTQVFCSILSRAGNKDRGKDKEKEKDNDKELCLDIAGENPSYGTPLLGYDCTGRWNQLFHLGPNCTIMAEQPAVVGRVRGNTGSGEQGGQSVALCLDARHGSGVVVTAPCEHLALPAASSVQVSSTGEVASEAERSTQDEAATLKATNVGQQFQFMTADGETFKGYMKR